MNMNMNTNPHNMHKLACYKESKQRRERTYTHWLLSAQSQLPHLSGMVSDKLRENGNLRDKFMQVVVVMNALGVGLYL